MLEKIFGPSVKYNKKTGQGIVKFARGFKAEIRTAGSKLETHNGIIKKIHDEFVLSSQGEDIANVDIYRAMYGKKPVYQGSIFMTPVILPFSSVKSFGKKLAKILNK